MTALKYLLMDPNLRHAASLRLSTPEVNSYNALCYPLRQAFPLDVLLILSSTHLPGIADHTLNSISFQQRHPLEVVENAAQFASLRELLCLPEQAAKTS